MFDGKVVSHYVDAPSPSEDSAEAKEAIRNVGRISLSGVQPKFAVVVDLESAYLRYVREDERGIYIYILKPRPNGYHILNKEYCAANEHLTMQIASQVYGIETEDFAALMGYTKAHGGSEYKYCNASYEEYAVVIRRYVKAASIDVARFFRLVVFNFITLNDDAHLKNFSLIDRNGEYRLSPAYDLINTSLHLVEPRIFALDKGLFREGMKLSYTHQVGRADFEEFGRCIGLPERVVKRELDAFAKENPR